MKPVSFQDEIHNKKPSDEYTKRQQWRNDILHPSIELSSKITAIAQREREMVNRAFDSLCQVMHHTVLYSAEADGPLRMMQQQVVEGGYEYFIQGLSSGMVAPDDLNIKSSQAKCGEIIRKYHLMDKPPVHIDAEDKH